MSAPKLLTLGELRAATADMPDDVRVVVDGYQGGYCDVSLCAPLVLLGEGHAHEGDHDYGGHDLRPKPGAVRCLCLARDIDQYDDDIAHVDALRTGGPDEDLRAQVAALTAELDEARAIGNAIEAANARVVSERNEARAERDRLRDVVEHAARTGSDATFRVAVCKGVGSGEKLTLVVTGPADREENMARSVAGLICATMSLPSVTATSTSLARTLRAVLR